LGVPVADNRHGLVLEINSIAPEQRNLQRKNLISVSADDDSCVLPLPGMTPGGPAQHLNASYRRHNDKRSVRTIDSTMDTSRPDPSGA